MATLMPMKLNRLMARVPGLYPLLALVTARRVVVRGWSMYPALAPGEHVLFDRLAYRLAPPRRGDVVLAYHPARPRLRMVKRVAAQPGDAVAMAGGRCWVNGVLFSAEGGQTPARLGGSASGGGEAPAAVSPKAPLATLTLGDDEYLLLGDAPEVSTDGRQLGPVRRDAIRARAWLVYWPPERMRVLRPVRPEPVEGRSTRREG